MTAIVSIHSYRGGTGKSNTTANLALLIAREGKRVAVLDTDLQSPGVHVVFGIDSKRITHTLTDFVLGKCAVEEAAYDMGEELDLGDGGGAVYLLPSSMRIESIMQIIDQGYDVGKLNAHFATLSDTLDLDLLLVDTHPGLNRETMLTTAISDVLVILIRPDSQDFHGTAVMVELAGRLHVPNVWMLANKVVKRLDPVDVRKKIKGAFGYDVVGVLPLDEDMASLGSRGLFAQKYPNHPITQELTSVAKRLAAITDEVGGDDGD
ncbi:MAG: CDP-3,6-dideoxy-D-glycero-L-glycero-4-hexulose-4-reductase [Planctomycetes bacterium]|nr:CDP-3,6-dideoxy-D-glycero-L-glycero-4-hexulose-4-reductase [Planctomycetota bacterium]